MKRIILIIAALIILCAACSTGRYIERDCKLHARDAAEMWERKYATETFIAVGPSWFLLRPLWPEHSIPRRVRG